MTPEDIKALNEEDADTVKYIQDNLKLISSLMITYFQHGLLQSPTLTSLTCAMRYPPLAV